MEEKRSVPCQFTAAQSLQQASIALAFPCSLGKCDAKLTLALLILLSQRQTPGRPSFRLLISAAPPLHPQGLIPPHRCSVLLSCDVHKAWSLSDTCARVRPMNTLILHHNLSLHLAFIASVAATLARKNLSIGGSFSSNPDALALQYVVECVSMECIIAHANTRMILGSMF